MLYIHMSNHFILASTDDTMLCINRFNCPVYSNQVCGLVKANCSSACPIQCSNEFNAWLVSNKTVLKSIAVTMRVCDTFIQILNQSISWDS
jgi:heterodisulfide reductase subunit A-like polyferredoxin